MKLRFLDGTKEKTHGPVSLGIMWLFAEIGKFFVAVNTAAVEISDKIKTTMSPESESLMLASLFKAKNLAISLTGKGMRKLFEYDREDLEDLEEDENLIYAVDAELCKDGYISGTFSYQIPIGYYLDSDESLWYWNGYEWQELEWKYSFRHLRYEWYDEGWYPLESFDYEWIEDLDNEPDDNGFVQFEADIPLSWIESIWMDNDLGEFAKKEEKEEKEEKEKEEKDDEENEEDDGEEPES